jgi:hypothetical protein
MVTPPPSRQATNASIHPSKMEHPLVVSFDEYVEKTSTEKVLPSVVAEKLPAQPCSGHSSIWGVQRCVADANYEATLAGTYV